MGALSHIKAPPLKRAAVQARSEAEAAAIRRQWRIEDDIRTLSARLNHVGELISGDGEKRDNARRAMGEAKGREANARYEAKCKWIDEQVKELREQYRREHDAVYEEYLREHDQVATKADQLICEAFNKSTQEHADADAVWKAASDAYLEERQRQLEESEITLSEYLSEREDQDFDAACDETNRASSDKFEARCTEIREKKMLAYEKIDRRKKARYAEVSRANDARRAAMLKTAEAKFPNC